MLILEMLIYVFVNCGFLHFAGLKISLVIQVFNRCKKSPADFLLDFLFYFEKCALALL